MSDNPYLAKKNSAKAYIGRFAPSPTGPLHFGSLIAATASYLCARQKQGQWLLRIEDVDIPRTQKGATQAIIQALEEYGFEWSGNIRYQSEQCQDYQDALDQLQAFTYPCSCTRKSLQARAATGTFSYIYPGYCRNGLSQPQASQTSMRLRSDINSCLNKADFIELCQATPYSQHIEKEVGDFILKRSDGLFSYQLAVVVDDHLQGVTDIVRGADLFNNTPRQNYLQCLLGYSQPRYLHFPVAVYDNGKKLSKQNASAPISLQKKRSTLLLALQFLGQAPPRLDNFSSIDDIWQWAVQNWDIDLIPKRLTQTIHDYEN